MPQAILFIIVAFIVLQVAIVAFSFIVSFVYYVFLALWSFIVANKIIFYSLGFALVVFLLSPIFLKIYSLYQEMIFYFESKKKEAEYNRKWEERQRQQAESEERMKKYYKEEEERRKRESEEIRRKQREKEQRKAGEKQHRENKEQEEQKFYESDVDKIKRVFFEAIFDLPKGWTEDDLKRIWRKKRSELHPDKYHESMQAKKSEEYARFQAGYDYLIERLKNKNWK
jgi:ABC-type multidrug transport system fused ATPase/permease subunit